MGVHTATCKSHCDCVYEFVTMCAQAGEVKNLEFLYGIILLD